MRILVFVLCVPAFSLVSTSVRLGARDTVSWSGFPALENGDSNSDGVLDLSDAVHLLSWLYTGGPSLSPLACDGGSPLLSNGDLNADEGIDLSDGVRLLAHLFLGGPAPAAACADQLFAVAAPGGGAANSNPRILPPGAGAYGKTYGEWSAAWWQWAISIAVPEHPLFDNADCDAGQSGPVWFLGGAFTGSATTRECTVPAGKALFIPIANVECSTVEPPPFFGANEEELRACAKAFQDGVTGMSATIDGREVQDLESYRVQSPLFSFSAPADNVLFIPGPVSGQAISDGFWILLAPLSKGEHVIHFAAFPGFPIDVMYNLTVK